MRRSFEGRGSKGVRRAWIKRVPLCSALVLAALLSLAGVASAFSQRGHELAGSFPGAGEAPALNKPTDVAVNETTGDIYVVDSANNRIVVYGPSHAFIATWGFGVKDGKNEFEVCTEAALCKPGIAGHKSGQLELANSIAVDNSATSPSSGDVYVEAVTPSLEGVETAVVDKFSGADPQHPALLAHFSHGKAGGKFEEPFGLGVGPQGELFVSSEGVGGGFIYEFSNELENKPTATIESEAAYEPVHGFAVAPGIGTEGGFYQAQQLPGNGAPTVVAKLATIHEEGAENLFAFPLTEALDTENSTGVADDPKTEDVYVDHGHSVAAFDSSAQLIQTFGTAGQIAEGLGLTVDSASGEVLVSDAGANRIDVFTLEAVGHAARADEVSATVTTATTTTLSAKVDAAGSNAEYAFRYSPDPLPAASQPCVSPCVELPAGGAPAGSGFGDVTVTASIEGLTPFTTYHYEVWVRNTAQPSVYSEAQGELKTQVAALGKTLPDARQWQLVSPPKKSGAAIKGFTTPESGGGLVQAAADGSGITYVSSGAIPGTAKGEEEPTGNRAPEASQIYSRLSGGEWVTGDIDTAHDAAEGFQPGENPEYRAFSSNLTLGLLEPYGKEALEHPPLSTEATERTPYIRHDATCATEKLTCYSPLATAANVPLGVHFGKQLSYVAATPDLSHVLVSAKESVDLTAEPTEFKRNLYVWSAGGFKLVNVLPEGQKLSEVVTEKQLVTVNPALGYKNGTPANVRNAISGDGARFFWSIYPESFSGQPSHLYMRDMGQPSSIQLDVKDPAIAEAPECVSEPKACDHAIFQTASADGSVVFFSDTQRLTANSAAHLGAPDLYACNIEETAGVPTGCKYTDLTPAGAGGAPGALQGLVLGASGDGDVVFYVANGPIAGNPAGTCTVGAAERAKGGEVKEAAPLATSCILYMSKYDAESESWNAPQAVDTLSNEDEFDWARGANPANAGRLTSRVSKTGEWVAFMSDRELTSYDPRQRTNNRGVEEVYLYNSNTGKTVCASCDPTGARPQGLLDQENSGEGIGLLVDRPLVWTRRLLSANVPVDPPMSANENFYPTRYLTDQGLVFFDSAEALVPQDTNGKEDVYEYEPAGVGGCTEASETYAQTSGGCVSLLTSGKAQKESVFLDASESGEDAFVLTAEQLTPLDNDSSFDVYDASVCGVAGRAECMAAPVASERGCESTEECRPGKPVVPPSTPLTSETTSPGGNASSPQHEVLAAKEESKTVAKPTTPKPLTRAQKLSKALKACHKLKQHKKRVSCERAARKKYGSKAKKSSTHAIARRGR